MCGCRPAETLRVWGPARTAGLLIVCECRTTLVLRGRRTRGPDAGPLVNHPRQGFPPWTSLTRCTASNCENWSFVHRYNTCRLLVFILLTAGPGFLCGCPPEVRSFYAVSLIRGEESRGGDTSPPLARVIHKRSRARTSYAPPRAVALIEEK